MTMSRAFVKEDANNQPEELPKRQSSSLPNYVTPMGRAGLQSRVAELSKERLALKAVKSDNPLENQRLLLLERDLNYYERRLKSSILVDNSACASGEVRFGAAVTVKDDSGKLQSFSIVGEDEADAAAGKISWASPLASFLLGARSGARLSWKRESGETWLEIVAVSYILK